jgi:hypothetical protein
MLPHLIVGTMDSGFRRNDEKRSMGHLLPRQLRIAPRPPIFAG